MRCLSLMAAAAMVALSQGQSLINKCQYDSDCRLYHDFAATCNSGLCSCTDITRTYTTYDGVSTTIPTYSRDADANICYQTYLDHESYRAYNPIINVTVKLYFTDAAATCAEINEASVRTEARALLNKVVPYSNFTEALVVCQPSVGIVYVAKVFRDKYNLLTDLNTKIQTELLDEEPTTAQPVSDYQNIWLLLNPSGTTSTFVESNHLPCYPQTSNGSVGAIQSTITQDDNSAFICQSLQCADHLYRLHENALLWCNRDAPAMDGEEIGGLVIGIILGLIGVALIAVFCMRKTPEGPGDDVPYAEVKEVEEVVEVKPAPPAPKPVPVPVVVKKEPAPAPVPVPVVVERVPEPEPEPEPVEDRFEIERAAGLVILRAMKRNGWRKDYLAKLLQFHTAEKARLAKIASGKAGSLGCAIDPDTMLVREKAFKADGAAGEGGMQPGDKVLLVRSWGRGGRVINDPAPDSVQFLSNVGPPNEVFEGTEIVIIVCRGSAVDKWNAKGQKWSRTAPGSNAEWIKAMEDVETHECNVTLKPETDGAKRTRVKKLNARKKELNIEKMDVDLVNQFMSDPVACREFTKTVFNKADADGSGKLEESEINGVFEVMAEHTGCPIPTQKEKKVLFYRMDEDGSGEIDFDEFYPHFRAHQIVAINEILFEADPEDDE